MASSVVFIRDDPCYGSFLFLTSSLIELLENKAGFGVERMVSEALVPRVEDVVIHGEVMGSDHCPVSLFLE